MSFDSKYTHTLQNNNLIQNNNYKSIRNKKSQIQAWSVFDSGQGIS